MSRCSFYHYDAIPTFWAVPPIYQNSGLKRGKATMAGRLPLSCTSGREQRVPAELLGGGGVHGPREPVDCLGTPCLQGRPKGRMEHLKGIFSRQSSMKHPQRGRLRRSRPLMLQQLLRAIAVSSKHQMSKQEASGAHGKAGCSGSGHSQNEGGGEIIY